jgi:CRP-like cAMP-binding protein
MGAMHARVAGLALDPFLDKLSREQLLSLEMRKALRVSVIRTQMHYEEQTLFPAEDRLGGPMIILSGWAARCRVLPDGKRQIFNFLMPGDLLDRDHVVWPGETTVCLTQVETVELGGLCTSPATRPEWSQLLARAVREETHAQDQLLFDHIVRLGQQNAAERTADLMFELHRRLRSVRLARENGFDLPLKQEHLAEALGLTLVHTNRTLQKLRGDRLLDFRRGKVTFLNWRRLSVLAGRTDVEGYNPQRPPPMLQESAA